MHKDSPLRHEVKCIWYLNDVNGSNGPFRYFPGTNIDTLKNLRRFPFGRYRFHDVVDGAKEVHANAGTLLVADTKAVHGGKPIESGARYAVTLYTFPTDKSHQEMFSKLGIGG